MRSHLHVGVGLFANENKWSCLNCKKSYTHIHRETMGLEGGAYLYHKMTPPPNVGHSWVVFEGWSQILPSTKLFRHAFEQSCSAMATQKLEEKVQQHDEVVESSKLAAGANRGHIAKHTSKCLHWSATPMPAASCAQLPFVGVILLSMSKITPLNVWGSKLKFLN